MSKNIFPQTDIAVLLDNKINVKSAALFFNKIIPPKIYSDDYKKLSKLPKLILPENFQFPSEDLNELNMQMDIQLGIEYTGAFSEVLDYYEKVRQYLVSKNQAYVFLSQEQSILLSTNKSMVFSAVFENMPMIAIDSVPWEQILEFRNDKDSVLKFRRFRVLVHELLRTSPNESIHFYSDRFSTLLDDYTFVLKKHGFKLLSSTIHQFLDPKFFATTLGLTTVAKYTLNDFWAGIFAGVTVIGGVTISFKEQLINNKDLDHGKNGEVGYLYKINQSF